MNMYNPETTVQAVPDRSQTHEDLNRTVSDGVGPKGHWQITVVDTCSYGRLGLVTALHAPEKGRHVVAVDSLAACPPPEASIPSCLVLRLPMTAQSTLSALLKLGESPLVLYSHVVVVTDVAPEVVRRMLISVGLRGRMTVVDGHQRLSDVCQALFTQMGRKQHFLAHSLYITQPRRLYTLLSAKERHVLEKTIREVSVYTQARQLQVSAKTIYSQRASALRKLGVPNVQALLRQFAPARAAVRRQGTQ